VAVTAGMLCRKCATSSSLRAGILHKPFGAR
jgi:hypothetical protein